MLLAAHGTRDRAGTAAFAALAKRVGDLAGRDGTRVAGGFIELSAPPLREAVASLMNEAVAPLMNEAVAPLMNEAVAPPMNEAVAPPMNEAVAPLVNGASPTLAGPNASLPGPAPAGASPAGPAPAGASPAGPAPSGASLPGPAPAGASLGGPTPSLGGPAAAGASLGGPAPAGASPFRMVAVPLMLSAAGHAKGDIPAALARERSRHAGLTFTYARPLGPHPALIDLLAARIAAVSDGGGCQRGRPPMASTAPSPAVLVVGRGSTDPDANADVVKTARLLWEGRDYPFAETAFVSLAQPGVTEGLERCRLLGARRIVVARYFLFPGLLPDRVADQARAYAAAHPGVEIQCTDVLGDCDEIAALVYERYHEALSGDIRMNCDVCVYRIAMPGFEHRVGVPQRPHDHPHDHDHGHG